MNLLLLVLWAFALPYPRFRPMASCLSTVWTCIIIVCKMLYQLKVVSPHEYSSNCTKVGCPACPSPTPGDGDRGPVLEVRGLPGASFSLACRGPAPVGRRPGSEGS